jgi:hypothetical protein
MELERLLMMAAIVCASMAACFLTMTAMASPQREARPPAPAELPPVTFPPGDWPWYAQEEITVNPEPPLASQSCELCAAVVNLDAAIEHIAILEFAVGDFGIGLRFTPVGRAEVVVPPDGVAMGCVSWVPRSFGPRSIQVRLAVEGLEDQFSQRNLDVDEPLEPGVPHSRSFAVRNPFQHPVTVTLGLIPHLAEWGLELSEDVLPGMRPGEVRDITLTVTPPEELPGDGAPIVDVEAFVGEDLMGGFRKIFRPPVPLHRLRDPV